MSLRLTLAALLLAAAASPAAASSFAGTTAGGASASSAGTSASSSGRDKVVVEARADAASFVASDGRIRGVRLEAALHHLRAHSPGARDASDLELARSILAL
ncbi:DUF2388 domain-containing protein [Luteimonas sp. Y-2-2-4F]|nr:DUF2388 domain-containing protein [Luteimonas sp. Y-2-2-4F]MCD9032027.1 DUF2388 domain-containing protein [Luteimonas sp. Y-2-2-4F]